MEMKMNGTFVPTISRGLMNLVCILGLGACALTPALAGTDMAPKTTDTKSMQGVSADLGTDHDWTVELGSGATWSNVRSGQPNQAYTIVPITLSASLKVDDVSLDNFLGGWLRGYTEFYFRGDYQQIVHGPENHVEDFMVGPRYNFVQPGWKIIPYVEGGVGIGFADSNPQHGGLGQDFNFSFLAGAGAKYLINDKWFVRAGVEYQHFSNAGLSEPTNPNHPIDALGPKISVGYAF
jgi:opacity protein-like surface antigen